VTAEALVGFTPAEHIYQSEMIVAGSAMLSARLADSLGEIVQPRHFRKPATALVFGAALALAEAAKPVDPVAVLAELTRCGDLRNAGGANYVHDCLAAHAYGDPVSHAWEVRSDAARRDAGAALVTALDYVRSPGFDPAEGFDHVRKIVDDATSPATASSGLPTMAEVFARVIDDLDSEKPRGLPTPWADVNELIGGLMAGDIVTIAGRTGAGKSLGLIGVCAHVAIRLGLPVLLHTMEMTADEVMLRIISAEARVSFDALLHRRATTQDWDRIARVQERISSAPLVIDDSQTCSLAHMRSRLRGMARTTPAALLAVDYIGLVDGPKAETRQQAVAEVTRGLKRIAGEFGIPILAAAQLNRGPENRHDKRPVSSDLRESGSIEQDSSVVILLHRPDLSETETARAGEVDFIVDKNRHGPRRTVTQAFQGHYARIVDMASDWSPSSAIGEQE
jgi:replicative DNA helicase